MDRAYSMQEIAEAWGISRQGVYHYYAEKRIVPDHETRSGPIWDKIPAKPAQRKRGPKGK